MRLWYREASAGSNIARPTTPTPTGQTLANAGASGVIEKGVVEFKDGTVKPLSELVGEYGTLEDALRAVSVAREALVRISAAGTVFVTFYAVGTYADQETGLSTGVADWFLRRLDPKYELVAQLKSGTGAFAPVPSPSVSKVDSSAKSGDDDEGARSRIWYHYTDQAGYESIMINGGTLLANNGRVYATPLALSPDYANTAIFIGGPPGYEEKGRYVVSFKFNDPSGDASMIPSSKPGEFYYPGTLRQGRQITIVGSGINPF
jgi:hypothetical protein